MGAVWIVDDSFKRPHVIRQHYTACSALRNAVAVDGTGVLVSRSGTRGTRENLAIRGGEGCRGLHTGICKNT